MDIPKMRQVVAIHRLGSLAKAADALGMSQPALSRSISRVEDELGVKIFERSSVGSALTPAGELLLERIERVIADAETLVRDAALFAGGDAGRVRIGVSVALRGAFLERFMLRLAKAHPNLKVHVELNGRAALMPLLASRDLDVVFTLSAQDGADAGYVVTPLIDVELAAVASLSHPLAGAPRMSFEAFTSHRHAGPPAKLTNPFFGPAAQNLEPFYTANDYEAILPLVLAGVTTLMAPTFVVGPLIKAGRFVRLDVDIDIDMALVAVATRASASAPIIRKIVEHASAVIGTLGIGRPTAIRAAS
jgi:DNA-binding transcriptional LysR family regulator